MNIVIVVAMSENRVIGRNGDLPWRLSADLKHFKAVTMGYPIIMGRKTWESIGRPLPGRRNIVVTRRKGFSVEGVDVVHSAQDALKLCETDNATTAMIIGGGQIYAEMIDHADRIELTEVHRKIEGDTHFPVLDYNEWIEKARVQQPAENGVEFSFVTLVRRQK